MMPFLVYILQAGLALGVFYVIYELFLKRETFFQLNRIYLVSGLLLSFLIPAFPITSPFRASAAVPAIDLAAFPPTSASRGIEPADVLVFLYGAGVLLFLLRFGLQLARLGRVVHRSGIRRFLGAKIVPVDSRFTPFSFLGIVFLSEGVPLDGNLRRILAHEQVHIRQQHTLDVLLMEIVLSLQWFNPFVWPYKKALQATHEYLADSGVIAQGFSSVKYQLLMFEQHVGASLFEFGNNFKKSQIKRRIMMLSKAKSPNAAKLKLLLALPLVFAEPHAAATAGTVALQEKVLKTSDPAAGPKVVQAQEEVRNLMAMEKEAAVRAELEKTTDEAKKDKLAEVLEKVLQKQADVKQMAKPYLTPAIVPSSIEELEKGMLKLQAKEKDVREKLAAVTDPQQKAELERTLHKVLQMQEGYKAGLEKAKAGKIAKTAKVEKSVK